MAYLETQDYKMTFDDSPEARDEVFAKVLGFYIEHQLFSGESLCQNDKTYEHAPELLSELADDIFCFDVEWKD